VRHFAACGNANRYRPVKSRSASGRSGEYVTNDGGFPPPWARSTKLAITVNVKAIDVQRWSCRILLFQFTGASL
jgi:hypothetical protein